MLILFFTENVNDKDSTKQTSKNITLPESEKILNGPILSNEYNESDRHGNDKVI